MTVALPVLKSDGADPAQLASSPVRPSTPDFQFERPDWVLFRQVNSLSQKAGVPSHRLRQLVLKELADNALDAGGTVTCGTTADGGYYVQDDGPGLLGSPQDIARLFSINRPLVSSKLWRIPTRGALGNGLRVVAGAIAASDGELRVWTKNTRLILTPQPDGSTALTTEEAVDFPVGTRIEIKFGPALPHDGDPLSWARRAIALQGHGETYGGRTSPHWYDASSFYELLLAAGDRPVREVITEFDGCTGATAGKIAGELKGRACNSISRAEAAALLSRAKDKARTVSVRRLGHVGPDAFPELSYVRSEAVVDIAGVMIPTVVEAWATTREYPSVLFYVNRTPITGEVAVWHSDKKMSFSGCGLNHYVDTGKTKLAAIVSVIAPYVPVTTDGKEPNLIPFLGPFAEAVQKATRIARRALKPTENNKPEEKRTHKDIVLAHIEEAISQVSGAGAYRFSQRQLYYVVRPFVWDESGGELGWGNFQQIITEYESEHGDIAGMYRDPRGTLYHPHTREDIPLGTRAVEDYERPDWTFNKVLYIEKEGFFEILKEAGWPERNDCALLTSKGYASRAVRDLIDLLADDGEPITVFCVHDADAAGTMIYQTLQEETAARPRRRVEIVNLGLDPWEAVELGLGVESFASEKRRPVADYVAERDDGREWSDWLQTKRIELNAFTTPALLEWLDRKIADYDGKVIPPAEVMGNQMRQRCGEMIEGKIKAAVLRDAQIPEKVAAALADVEWRDDAELQTTVERGLDEDRQQRWADVIDCIADDLAGDQP